MIIEITNKKKQKKHPNTLKNCIILSHSMLENQIHK